MTRNPDRIHMLMGAHKVGKSVKPPALAGPPTVLSGHRGQFADTSCVLSFRSLTPHLRDGGQANSLYRRCRQNGAPLKLLVEFLLS